ncbi:MAG: hypothetical protein ACRCX8_15760 [Sarcina sp.]
MAGILIEKRIMARNVDSLNRSAKATVDVDGGGLVKLTTLDAKDKDVFTATAPVATTDSVWMAYDPSERLTVVNGKYFAGLTQDPRDYTNLATRVMDVYKPQVGDIIGVLMANVTGQTAPTVGKFLEPTAGATTLSIQSSATALTTSYKVIEVATLPFPQAGIGMSFVPMYVCECVQAV